MIKCLVVLVLILQMSKLSPAPNGNPSLIDLDIIPREKPKGIDYTEIIAPSMIASSMAVLIYMALFDRTEKNKDQNHE